MSEILSQEQIDSLLSQRDLPPTVPSDGETASSGSGPSKDYGALRKAFELFCERAGGTMSMIFNKKAVFETLHCAAAEEAKARENLAPPLWLLTIPFKSGFEGSLWCVLGQKDVAHFSDLMMMGDGTAAFTSDHKDAVVELFSQIFGAFTTALGEKLGAPVGTDRISASPFDFGSPPAPLEASELVVVQGMIGEADAWRMHFLVPADLGAQFMRTWGAGADAESGQATETDPFSMAEGEASAGAEAPGDGFIETTLAGDSVRGSGSRENIDMLLDVELDVYIELGRANLSIKRILELSPGSIVELDRMAGEPVDLLVNEKVIARGEVVVLDENFGIRIVSLVSAEDRIKSLR
jgi:flagellar motor switch protein FliN